MSSAPSSRRKFIRNIGGTAALLVGNALLTKAASLQQREMLEPPKRVLPNDKIRIACIGMGIMGFGDTRTALKVPGVELAAVCDLYKGRLERAKEVFGKDIFTTGHYRDILDRKDIDAVIIAVSDNWHDKISIDAMEQGKAVYCEKPMVHQLEEGQRVIAAQQKTKMVFQVGSQRTSSILYSRAKKLYEDGEIGALNMVEASIDRHDALGAWKYSIPPDASPLTVDFDTFLGNAPKLPFDPVRFFRWRNYREYGTGIPGDLFVHLITGLHFITGSMGPTRVFASGGLRYWKDGRNVPDVMVAIFDYPDTPEHPAFQFTLKVNFVDGGVNPEDSSTRLTGSDGTISIGWNEVTLKKNKLPKAPGYGGWDSFETFPEAMQKEFAKQYAVKYGPREKATSPADVVFSAPEGYDDRLDHFTNFFESVRNGKTVVEDAVFSLRAAAPALASNLSYFGNKVIHWDPVSMKLV